MRELAARKLPEVEALITRAHAMRDWLQTATDCSCTTLDACALFDPDRPAATGGDFAPLLITHVTLGRVLLADS